MYIEVIALRIQKWLEKNGYSYAWNIRLGTKTPDLICFKDNRAVALEIKKHAYEISTAIGQCLSYLEHVNKVYILLPFQEFNKISTESFNLLKKYGIGLISVNKKIEIIIEAKFYEKNVKNLIEKIKERTIPGISLTVPEKERREELNEKIKSTLNNHPEGLTILEVAKLTGSHRHTASKYLIVLEAAGDIVGRRLGPVSLWYLKKDYTPARRASR